VKTSAILFDLDGTLTDTLPLIKDSYEQVFKLMNLPWTDGEVLHWIGRPLLYIASFFAKGREEEFLELYYRFYNQELGRRVSLFPGTLEMLQNLKEKGLRLGIVTSKGSEGTKRTIELTALPDYMDVIITAGDVSKHKPFPDPVLKALDLLYTPSQEAIFIGDSHFDIQAGQKAGTITLGVTWGIASREELTALQPDGLLETWADLKLFTER